MNKISKTLAIIFGAVLLLNNATFADDRSRSGRPSYSKQRSAPPSARKSKIRSTPARYAPAPVYPNYYRPGYHVSRPLPRGASRVVDRSDYYFYDGYFYRPYQSGYVIVDSPIGAIVTSLPRLHHRVTWRGAPYFVVGNTFYRQHPRGYIVVNNPGITLMWR